jgi:hypothetical protein
MSVFSRIKKGLRSNSIKSIFLCVFLVQISYSVFAVGNEVYLWTQRTSVGQRVWNQIAWSSDWTQLVATATDWSVYTSGDSWSTWVPKTKFTSTLAPYDRGGISVSTDGAKLAALTFSGYGYVYTSTNGGGSWTERTGMWQGQWESLAASSNGSKLVIWGRETYIYTSTNGGATWVQRTASWQRDWQGIASSADGTKLAAVDYNRKSVGQGGYIYTSTNSGANWTQTNAPESRWIGIASSADGTKLAAITYSYEGWYIYTSINSGWTWTQLTNAGRQQWRGISISSDGAKIVASIQNGDVYTSRDSGQTWVKQIILNNAVTGQLEGTTDLFLSQDGSKIFASTGNYIYTAILGVDSTPPIITSVSSNKPDGTYSAGTIIDIDVTFSESVSGILTVTLETGDTDRTCIMTVSNSMTGTCNYTVQTWDASLDLDVKSLSWTLVDAGNNSLTNFTPVTSLATTKQLVIGGVICPSGSTGSYPNCVCVSGFTYNVTSSTCVKNYTWTQLFSSWQRQFQTIASSADWTKLVAGGNFSGYFTSSDSGATWTERTRASPIRPRTFFSIASSSDWTKLAAVDFGLGSIYTSTNSGVTWVERSSWWERWWTSIASSSDWTKLAAVTDWDTIAKSDTTGQYKGSIYTSSDSGATWTERTSIAKWAWRSITSSADWTKLAVVGEAGYIITSSDSGDTWTERTNAWRRNWTSIISSADGTKLSAVAQGGFIYTSSDSGVTWIERNSSGQRFWRSITSSADGTILAAVDGGIGLIYISSDSGATWTAQTSAGSRQWFTITSSADGTKLVAAGTNTYIYTTTPDTAPPIITSISSDKPNGTYSTGTTIDIDVTFSEPVAGVGTVTLETGTTDRTCTFTVSSSTTATCNYTVMAGDISADLDVKSITWTLADWANNQLTNFTPITSLATNKALVVWSITGNYTWSQQLGGSGFTSIASSSDGTKLAGVGSYLWSWYIYTSTDSGVTWIARSGAWSRYWRSITSSADGTKLAAIDSGNLWSGGGIYISDNSGATWTQVGAVSNWTSITSSADGTKLSAVNHDGANSLDFIYLSWNSGTDWSHNTPVGAYGLQDITSSADGTKLAFITDSFVFTSSDSGATWTKQNTPLLNWESLTSISSSADWSKLAVTQTDSHGGYTGGGVYTSTDSWATWIKRMSAWSRNWDEITSSADGSVLVAVASGPYSGPYNSSDLIYTSTDSGATWTEETYPGNKHWTGVASSADGTKIIVTADRGAYMYTGVLKSGVPPTLSAGLPTGTQSSSSVTLGVTTNKAATCKYSTTANTAYSAMTNTFATTGGTTHTKPLTGLASWSHTYYVRCSDTTNNVNTTDFVITFSVGAACVAGWELTWTKKTYSVSAFNWWNIVTSADGTKLAGFHIIDSRPGGLRRSIVTSSDSGATWTERTNAGIRIWYYIASSADGTKLVAIEHSWNVRDDNTTYNAGYIYTSSDSGATWTRQDNAGQREWSAVTSSADGTKLAATVGNGRLYTSSDSGVTWVERMWQLHWSSITSSADGTKLAAMADNIIFVSSDSGVTWSNIWAPGSYHNYVHLSADGTKLFTTNGNQNGYIIFSINFWATWTPITTAGERIWRYITTSADGTKISAIADGYIYVSIDSGITWTKQTNLWLKNWQGVISANGQQLFMSSGEDIYTASLSSCDTCPLGSTGIHPSCTCPAGSTYDAPTNTCIAPASCANTQAPSELKVGVDQPLITCTGNGDMTKTHFKYRIKKQGSPDVFTSEIFPLNTQVRHPTMTAGAYTVECFYGTGAQVDTSVTVPPHPCAKTITVNTTANGCSRIYPYKGSSLSEEIISVNNFDASFRCGSRAPLPSTTNPYSIRVGTQSSIFLQSDALISELFADLWIGPVSTQTQSYPFYGGTIPVTCAVKVGWGYSTNTSCSLNACTGANCEVPQTYSLITSGDQTCTNSPESTYSLGCNPDAPDIVRNQCIQKFREAIAANGASVPDGTAFDVTLDFDGVPSTIQCIQYAAGKMPGGMNLTDNVVCQKTLKNGERYQIYSADANQLQSSAKTMTLDTAAPTLTSIKYYTDDTLATEVPTTAWYNKPVIAVAVCSDTPRNEAIDCACLPTVDPSTTDASEWSPGIPNNFVGADLMLYTRMLREPLSGTNTIRIADKAGNQSPTKTLTLPLDTKPPTITVTESGTWALKSLTLIASDADSKIWKTTTPPSDAKNTKNFNGIVYRVGPKSNLSQLLFDDTCDSVENFALPSETQAATFPSQATLSLVNIDAVWQVVTYCVRDNAGNTTRGIYPAMIDSCFSATNMPIVPTIDTYKDLLKNRLASSVNDNQKYGYSFSENAVDAGCFRGIISQNITTLIANQLVPRTNTTLSNWTFDLATIKNTPNTPNTDGYYYYSFSSGINNTVSITSTPTGTGTKSVIVDGGHIHITKNLVYPGNNNLLVLIAQKNSDGEGGDIIIDPSVTRIDALLIASGGTLRSSNISTPTERLTINGRIYSYNTRGGSLALSGADLIPSPTPKIFNNSVLENASNFLDAQKQDLERLRPIIFDGREECSIVLNYQVFTTSTLPRLWQKPTNYQGGNCGF